MRSYVGPIEAVDAHGVRITLIDWLIGNASSWDVYAPWESITCALIATPAHDVERCGEMAANGQKRMDESDGEATAKDSEREAS